MSQRDLLKYCTTQYHWIEKPKTQLTQLQLASQTNTKHWKTQTSQKKSPDFDHLLILASMPTPWKPTPLSAWMKARSTKPKLSGKLKKKDTHRGDDGRGATLIDYQKLLRGHWNSQPPNHPTTTMSLPNHVQTLPATHHCSKCQIISPCKIWWILVIKGKGLFKPTWTVYASQWSPDPQCPG